MDVIEACPDTLPSFGTDAPDTIRDVYTGENDCSGCGESTLNVYLCDSCKAKMKTCIMKVNTLANRLYWTWRLSVFSKPWFTFKTWVHLHWYADVPLSASITTVRHRGRWIM